MAAVVIFFRTNFSALKIVCATSQQFAARRPISVTMIVLTPLYSVKLPVQHTVLLLSYMFFSKRFLNSWCSVFRRSVSHCSESSYCAKEQNMYHFMSHAICVYVCVLVRLEKKKRYPLYLWIASRRTWKWNWVWLSEIKQLQGEVLWI